MGTDLQLRQHDIEKFDDRLNKIDKQIQQIETFLKDTHRSEENDRMLMNKLYLRSINDKERIQNKKTELIKREKELLDGSIQKLYNDEIKNLFNATDANNLIIENHLRKFYNNESSNHRMPSDSILKSSDRDKSVFDYKRRNRSGTYVHSQPGYSGSLMETMYSTPNISQLTTDAFIQKLTPGHPTYDPILGFSGQKMFSVDIHSNVCEFDIGIAYVTKDSPFLIQKTGDTLVEQNVSNDGESELMRRFYGNVIVSNCTDNMKDLSVKSLIMCSDNEFVNDLGPKFYFRIYRDISRSTKRLYLVLIKYDAYRYYYSDNGTDLIFEDIFDINVKKTLEGFDTVIPNIDINVSLKNNSFRGEVFTSADYNSLTVQSLESVDFTVQPRSHGIIQLNGIKPTAAPERIFPKKSEPIIIEKDFNTSLSQHADDVYDRIMREINENDILKNGEKVLVEAQTVIGTENGTDSKIIRIDKIKKVVSIDKKHRASSLVQVGHRVKFPFHVNGTSDVNIVRNVEILKTVVKLTFQYGIDRLIDTDVLEFLDIGKSFFMINETYQVKKGSNQFDLTSYMDRNGFRNSASDVTRDEMKYHAKTFNAFSRNNAPAGKKKFIKTIVYKDHIYGIPPIRISRSSPDWSRIAKYDPRSGRIEYSNWVDNKGKTRLFNDDNYRGESTVIKFKNYVYMLPCKGRVYFAINLDSMAMIADYLPGYTSASELQPDQAYLYHRIGDNIIRFPYLSLGNSYAEVVQFTPNMQTGRLNPHAAVGVRLSNNTMPFGPNHSKYLFDSTGAVNIGSSVYAIPHHKENNILEIRYNDSFSNNGVAYLHNIVAEDRIWNGTGGGGTDEDRSFWVRWRKVVAIKNRYLYAIPWEWTLNRKQRWILKFDTVVRNPTRSSSKIWIAKKNETTSYNPDGGGQFIDAVVVNDRYIYCIPTGGNKIVKLDTNNDDELTFIDVPQEYSGKTNKFSHGILFGTDIFCIPHTNYINNPRKQAVIIDTTNDSTSTFDMGDGIISQLHRGGPVIHNDALYMFTWTNIHPTLTGGVVVSKKKERDYVKTKSLHLQENKLNTYHTSTKTITIPNKITEANIDRNKLLLKKNYFAEINTMKEPVKTTIQVHNRLV